MKQTSETFILNPSALFHRNPLLFICAKVRDAQYSTQDLTKHDAGFVDTAEEILCALICHEAGYFT